MIELYSQAFSFENFLDGLVTLNSAITHRSKSSIFIIIKIDDFDLWVIAEFLLAQDLGTCFWFRTTLKVNKNCLTFNRNNQFYSSHTLPCKIK